MIKYLQNIGNNKIFRLNVYVTNNKSSISNLYQLKAVELYLNEKIFS